MPHTIPLIRVRSGLVSWSPTWGNGLSWIFGTGTSVNYNDLTQRLGTGENPSIDQTGSSIDFVGLFYGELSERECI